MTDKAHTPAPDSAAEGKIIDDGAPSLSGAATDFLGARAGVKPGGGPETGKDAGKGAGKGAGQSRHPSTVGDMVDQPAKVMRIGTMVKQLLDEVKSAPLDAPARARLVEIHERSIAELEDGLAPELVSELHRLSLPFTDETTPSDAELRIAQAQLVGWLEGLFRGIQTAMAAQAMANQQLAAKLAMHQLPPGTVLAPGVVVDENGEPRRATVGQPGGPSRGPVQDPAQDHADSGSPGQYL